MAFTKETRVRLAEDSEAGSRHLRSGSSGQWLVERYWTMPWANSGYYSIVSSHATEGIAIKAKERLDRKIAKQAS